MHALVTGAAGFIGSNLVEALLARGATVRGVDCFTPYYDPGLKRANVAEIAASGFELVEADLRRADLGPLLDGVDVVFHEAAQPGVAASWSALPDYLEHNVVVTQRLLAAVRDTGPIRFVYASSSSVYGNAPRYPTAEGDLPAPASPYGVTKLAAEQLCGAYAAEWGVPTVTLRYFTVFGPRQRPDMAVHRLCDAALTGTPFPRYGDGEQVREMTFVADVVAATIAAGTTDLPPGSVLNVAGGAEMTLNGLVALVGELVAHDVAVEELPARPGDARRNAGATQRARALLGWEPRVGLREGLERQLAWQRSRATR